MLCQSLADDTDTCLDPLKGLVSGRKPTITTVSFHSLLEIRIMKAHHIHTSDGGNEKPKLSIIDELETGFVVRNILEVSEGSAWWSRRIPTQFLH